MSRKTFELREGAVVIGDAHYSSLRPYLLDFLRAIDEGTIPTPQIIFMGDVFDLLLGDVPLTLKRNEEAVELINRLSLTKEVVYLEGNHDFRLAAVFPKARVFPLGDQPVACRYGGKKVLLAHGDFGLDAGYRIYTWMIRSRAVLRTLRWIDTFTGNRIIKWLDGYLEKKEDCNRFEGFESYVGTRLEPLDLSGVDYFVEGHFHQNVNLKVKGCRYTNLAAFACNQRYFIVQSIAQQELLEEVIFLKGPA